MQKMMKALSQYFKKSLFTHKHPTQPIFVFENLIHRWLCFDDKFVQTIINKYALHRPVLTYLPALCINLNLPNISTDIVMLGAGGGAIVHYVDKFHTKASLTLVEKNEMVAQLARQFFYVNAPIVLKDASEHLEQMPPCSHLFVDIFTNNLLPGEIKHQQFIDKCSQKALFAVSFNILSQNMDEMKKTIINLRKTFKNQTLCVFVKGKTNVVLHAYREKHYLQYIEQLTKLKIIEPPQFHSDYGLISQ